MLYFPTNSMNNYKIIITHTHTHTHIHIHKNTHPPVIRYMLVMDWITVQHTQWQKPPYTTGHWCGPLVLAKQLVRQMASRKLVWHAPIQSSDWPMADKLHERPNACLDIPAGIWSSFCSWFKFFYWPFKKKIGVN